MRILCSLLLVLLSLLILFIPGPFKGDKGIIIQHGSLIKVSEILQENNAVYNKFAFLIPAKIFNYFQTLHAGEYLFEKGASIFEIIRKMRDRDVIIHKLIIPEGLTSYEIIAIINNTDLLSGTIVDLNIPEGSLLPETYHFTRGTQKQLLISRMTRAMTESVNKLWAQRNTDLPLKSKKELVILASIVEKEAKSDEDRKKIASVFLNRLKKGMKLQADPTVIYAITKGQYKLQRNLLNKDLHQNSPWNTYYIPGLPLTPIANPGLEALKVTAQSISTNYLYFVVRDCKGNHIFSSNLNTHQKNVRLYRRLKCTA